MTAIALRLKPKFEISILVDKLEIILFHAQIPLRVPCYDLVLIIDPTFGPPYGETSGITNFPDLTGSEYKTQEHIHRHMADWRLLAIPASWSRIADSNPN